MLFHFPCTVLILSYTVTSVPALAFETSCMSEIRMSIVGTRTVAGLPASSIFVPPMSYDLP